MKCAPVLSQLDCRTIDNETAGHCCSEILSLHTIAKSTVSSSHKERQDSPVGKGRALASDGVEFK